MKGNLIYIKSPQPIKNKSDMFHTAKQKKSYRMKRNLIYIKSGIPMI